MTRSSSTSPPPPTPSSSGEPDQAVLDLTGEICPYTFVRTRLALEALPLGARLRVVVDHEPARRNVPRSAVEWGQEVASTELLPDGKWAITLIKRVC